MATDGLRCRSHRVAPAPGSNDAMPKKHKKLREAPHVPPHFPSGCAKNSPNFLHPPPTSSKPTHVFITKVRTGSQEVSHRRLVTFSPNLTQTTPKKGRLTCAHGAKRIRLIRGTAIRPNFRKGRPSHFSVVVGASAYFGASRSDPKQMGSVQPKERGHASRLQVASLASQLSYFMLPTETAVAGTYVNKYAIEIGK